MRTPRAFLLGLALAAAWAAVPAMAGEASQAREDEPRGVRGEGAAYEVLGKVPVLHAEPNGSRIKPLDTFARLKVQEIYGKEQIKLPSKDDSSEKWSALGALLDWPVRPEFWNDQEILLIDLFDYRPFKQKLLAEPVRMELKRIRSESGLSQADRAAVEKLLDSPFFSDGDLEKLAALKSLPKPDRQALLSWKAKLSEGHKWISASDLENAVIEVDDQALVFMDWFRAIFDKARQAKQEQRAFKPTPLEQKAIDLGQRLVEYQSFRDGNELAVREFEVLIVPRPVNDQYLKYTGDIIRRLIAIRDLRRHFAEYDALSLGVLEPLAAASDETPTLSEMEAEAFSVLRSYLEDRKSVNRFLAEIESGEENPPGASPVFDKGFRTWLKKTSAWMPLRLMLSEDVDELARAGFQSDEVEEFRSAYHALIEAEREAPGALSEPAAAHFLASARALGESNNPTYPSDAEMARETFFNRFAPFSKAPWFYGAGLVCLLITLGMGSGNIETASRPQKALYGLGMLGLFGGIVMETIGFYLRVRISGWAPVTNMYETVIWVAAVSAVLGFVFELIFRRTYAAIAASGMAMLGTLLAANVSLLNPNIGSLPPVLRDRYWLVVHVLTIVSSYAAFTLTMGLGLLAVGHYLSATYRRDVRYREAASPMLLGLPLSILALIGLFAMTSGADGGMLNNTPGYVLLALLGVPGGFLLVSGLYGFLGEFANRQSGASLISGLAVMAAGMLGVYAVSGRIPPEWWPKELPMSFPPGLVAVVGFSMAVMSLLGGQSRKVYQQALATEELEEHSQPPSAEAEPEYAGSSSGSGSVATLARPSVGEILSRASAYQPKLDARGQAMQATASQIKPLASFIYRAMQVGVLLVAAGTILGGIWADVSWGRFWGWDAKEVWALITLLVYLVPLHGRFAGWITTFGLVAASVVGYMSVLMAWYGVNFIISTGLHSYGFTEGGGQGVVISSAVAMIAVVGGAGWRRWLGLRRGVETA